MVCLGNACSEARKTAVIHPRAGNFAFLLFLILVSNAHAAYQRAGQLVAGQHDIYQQQQQQRQSPPSSVGRKMAGGSRTAPSHAPTRVQQQQQPLPQQQQQTAVFHPNLNFAPSAFVGQIDPQQLHQAATATAVPIPNYRQWTMQQ